MIKKFQKKKLQEEHFGVKNEKNMQSKKKMNDKKCCQNQNLKH